MPGQRNMTPEDYEKARRHLMRRDKMLGAAIKQIGPCGMAERQRSDHLTALVGAIASQQLSTKAAATIFGRFVALFPEGRLQFGIDCGTCDAALRGVGLSGQKVGYLRDLSARIIDGRLQLDELEPLPDDQVIERLRGPWVWSLDRGDVPDVSAAPARRPAGRRSRHRQRDDAVVSAAQEAGREAHAEDRRSVEAVSFCRLLVSLAVAQPGRIAAGDDDHAQRPLMDPFLKSSNIVWEHPCYAEEASGNREGIDTQCVPPAER